MADASQGETLQCSQCAFTFVLDETAIAVLAPARPVLREALEPEAYGDIEQRRSPSDYEPHRGELIKTLGLLSLVGGVLFLGLPLVLGPVAWVLGSRDLRAMDDGHMDPRGRKATYTGWWCGTAASVLLMLALAVIGLMNWTDLVD